MPANLLAAVLSCALAFLAALGAAFPAPATAQIGTVPFRQQHPTGLLGLDDEAAKVARALDEAQHEIQNIIHLGVVADETGRRVSTDWMLQVPESGDEYVTKTPMPVLAEDANAPGGIVALVDPFQRKAPFVEAPEPSGRDERYPSGLMTDRFRRGPYADGLTAVAHAPEGELAPHAPHPASPSYREPAATRTVSGSAMVLFTGGIAAVVLLLAYFLSGERYRRPGRPDRGIAFVTARHKAESILSALAPRVLLLAEKEAKVIGRPRSVEGSAPKGPGRVRAEDALGGAVPNGFWGSFVRVTALIERDPEGALVALRGLSTQVETALARLGQDEEALDGSRPDEGLEHEGTDTTRRDESDE